MITNPEAQAREDVDNDMKCAIQSCHRRTSSIQDRSNTSSIRRKGTCKPQKNDDVKQGDKGGNP